MKAEITVIATAQGDNTLHLAIECRPNVACIPPGYLRDLVVRMLDAGTVGMKQTLDVRVPVPLLKLTEVRE